MPAPMAIPRSARLCAGERRRVVDAVAHHGHGAPGLLELADLGLLLRGQHAGDDLVHAHLPRHGGSGALLVAGEKHRAGPHRAEPRDGRGARALHGVGHGDHAEGAPAKREEQRGLAVVRERRRRVGERAERHATPLHEAGVSGERGARRPPSPQGRRPGSGRTPRRARPARRPGPSRPRRRRWRTQAGARSCARGPAATRSSSSSETPGARRTSVTRGAPAVTVPVLSSTTASTLQAVSSASADLMRIPLAAPRPVPTMMAVGVARPRAHGQEITRIEMACVSAVATSPASASQATNVTAAMAMTTGTKTPAILSAMRSMGALELVASSTRRMIPASVVSSPTARASRASQPRVETVGAGHAVAGGHLARHALPRDGGLVDGGRALHHHAVHRHRLAGAHDHALPPRPRPRWGPRAPRRRGRPWPSWARGS